MLISYLLIAISAIISNSIILHLEPALYKDKH